MMDLAPWLCWIFPFLGAILVYPADKVSKKLRDFIAVIFPFLSVISAASLISNLLGGEYYDQKLLKTRMAKRVVDLYPDTDTPPIILSENRINAFEDKLPLYPWDVIKIYSKKYQLEEFLIEDLIMTGKLPLFDELITKYPDNPMLIVRAITDMVKVLHREEKDTNNLHPNHYHQIFKGLKEEIIAKEAIQKILRVWCDEPNLPLTRAKAKAGVQSVNESKLDEIITDLVRKNQDLIKSRGRGAVGPLMGDLMKIVGRGSIDGKILSSKLSQAISKILPNSQTTPKKKKEKKKNKKEKKEKKKNKKQKKKKKLKK